MANRYASFVALVLVLAAPLTAVAEESALAGAYDAILRGDFEAGRQAVTRLLQERAPDQVQRAGDWLQSYRDVVSERQALKQQTFNWNIEQGKAALAEGKVFVALNFAHAASAYAADKAEFAKNPWIAELTQRCRVEAEQHAAAGRWRKSLNFYALLARVHKENNQLNDELDELRKNAARHARLELLYDDEESLREHIQDVDRDMLRRAVRLIDRLYYQDPDFKKAAEGALANLETLCETPKLFDYLDGLANPALRGHFERGLQRLRDELDRSLTYDHKDLLSLFYRLSNLNRESIEIPDELLVVEFLEGVSDELDDYTSVIWPADAKDFDKVMMGGFEGVGIQLGLDERTNRLKVVTPLENSPALEAGIQPDDIIVAVDGKSTKGWSTDDAVKNIMGPAGSRVILTMLRPETGERIPFELTRRQIVLTSVRGVKRIPGTSNDWDYMIDPVGGIAYVRLTNFLPTTHHELRDALRAADRQGMKALILDVRHNPGGLLDVAVDVISNFIDYGEVVSTRGRVNTESRERVAGRAEYKDIPLVVLVNEGSASASEILAGALQDHNRAIVLGGRTFGKGSVQHIRALSRDARLKLTTALYYLPDGRTPHKLPDADEWGVEPDFELVLTPKEFTRIIERERESYIIHNEVDTDSGLSDAERDEILAGLEDEEEDKDEDPPLLSDADIKLLEADPYDAPKTDPQLETALFMLRLKVATNMPWPREFAAADQDAQPNNR